MTVLSRDEIRATAHAWRAKTAAGDLTQDERAAFERWMSADPRHGAVYAEAEVLWQALGEIDYAPEMARPLISEKVRSFFAGAVGNFAGGSHRGGARVLAGAAALASLAIALVAVQIFTNAPVAPVETVYRTATSELEEFTLDDGSVITLGANSRVVVAMSSGVREVRLASGEAYFDVAKDPERPFEVAAGATRVRAIGTAFDVQKKAGALSVSVAEGVVEVSHGDSGGAAAPDTETVRVAAGRRVAVSKGGALGEVVDVAASDLAAWRSGVLVYFGARLDEVVSDANRYYDRSIRIDPEAARLKLSGSFRADDIDTMLLAMSEALPITVTDLGAAGVLIRAVE